MASKTQRKMKPILYPQAFLEKEIQRKWATTDDMSRFICLVKYFPKYYKNLEINGRLQLGDLVHSRRFIMIYGDSRTGSIRSRYKQLKTVKRLSYKIFSGGHVDWDYDNHRKTFKKLCQCFRKTLESLPRFDGESDPYLCMHFPRVKTINLPWHHFNRIVFENSEINFFDPWKKRELSKKTRRLCGHFWSENRFVENLRMHCFHPLILIVIKKLNGSKRFLSSLKALELEVDRSSQEIMSEFFIELIKNKSFLQHVTHLRIGSSFEDWKVVQSLINCCPQVVFLSIDFQYCPLQRKFNENFSLGCLQNLQELKIEGFNFQTFITLMDFAPSIREITLFLLENEVKEAFDCQDEDEDAREWKAFEQDRTFGSFFEQWRKFENLKVLKLQLSIFSNLDFVMKMFLLPLLREKPQLETLECYLDLVNGPSEEGGAFDLDVFFQGIKSLKSLKNLSLTFHNGVFIYSPQKSLFLLNCSSLHISAGSSQKFDISKFLNGVYHNLESQSRNEKTSLSLSKIRLYSAQELIKLLNLLSKSSEFKNLQIYVEVELYVQGVDEIISNFRYPIYVPSNAKLKVHLFEAYSDWDELTQNKKLNLREGPYEFPQIQSFFK